MNIQQQAASAELKAIKNELLQEVAMLDRLIERIERRTPSQLQPVEPLPQSSIEVPASSPSPDIAPVQKLNGSSNKDNGFPRYASGKEQVLFLLNQLKQAVRFPELQETYTKISGLSRLIRHDVAALKHDGLVTTIIYNNYTQQVYLGLTEWVEKTESGPGFKSDFFKPDPSNFPNGIWKSEFADASRVKEEV